MRKKFRATHEQLHAEADDSRIDRVVRQAVAHVIAARRAAIPDRERLVRMSKEEVLAEARKACIRGASARWAKETLVARLLEAKECAPC